MASLLGERAFGQGDQTSGMLLSGCQLVFALRIILGLRAPSLGSPASA
jgi:hypothetical protein